MAKVFLNRQRGIPTALNRDEEEIAPSSSRSCLVTETTEQLPFMILDETSKFFRKFNATESSLLIKCKSPGEEQDPTVYLKECITALTNCLVDKLIEIYLVGLKLRNPENVQDKVVGINLPRPDQLKHDVVWSVFGKVIQSYVRFFLTDCLKVHLDHVRKPDGNCREKTRAFIGCIEYDKPFNWVFSGLLV